MHESSKIWTITRKELLENLISYRFFMLTGLLCALVAVSIIVSYGDYQLRLEHYNLNRPDPTSSNVMLPPNALSIFAKGAEGNLSRLYWVHAGFIETESSQQSINRLFSLFIVPDMLFIIKVLLSLLALLFSFDAITGEKESGTLKLALASGTPRTSLLFGKLLGRFALLFIPFFMFFTAAAITVSLLPNVDAAGYYWQRLTCMLIVSALYVAVFCSLGMFLSSVAHRSSTSLILSLAAWVLLVFVVPQLGTALARSVAGVPPGDRVEMQRSLASVRADYERVLRERVTGSGNEDESHLRDLRSANRDINDSYRPQLNRCIGLTRGIVRLSPAGSATFLIADVLNTGVYEELRLKDALSLYQDRNYEMIAGLVKGNAEGFHYERASLSEVFAQSVLIDLVIIVVFGLAFTALATMSFSRYDAR